MAFCAKCGTQLSEGTGFCGSCGAPVGAMAAPGPPAAAAGSGLAPNVAGLLAYVAGFVTGIIFLVIEPMNRDKFVRFHAFQSIFFSVAWIVISIAFSILSAVVSSATSGFGGLIMFPLHLLLWLVMLGLWAFLMYKAYNNERFKLPIIGALAEKQAG